MAQQDFFTGIFPFLLSYIIFFLALQKTPIFSEQENKRYSALVAVIFAFFVSYAVVMNPVYQEFFHSYLSSIVIGMVGLLGFLVFLTFIPGFDLDNAGARGLVALVVLGSFAAFIFSGGMSAFIPVDVGLPGLEYGLAEVLDYIFESGLIYLIIIGAALAWVTSDGGDGDWGKKAKDAGGYMIRPVGHGGG